MASGSSCSRASEPAEGSISLRITDISVVSITRRRNSTQAMSSPTSMATVRSKTTVRKKVTSRTALSERGVRSKARKVRQPLML